MKKIFRIARVELSIMFYSPVAWLLLIVFVIQCGITLTDLLDVKAASQELGTNFKGLTKDVFGGYKAFFNAVKDKIHLYIPLLTMGLLSRELSSGSIKLLYSSPVTNVQIIIGKYLAMMVYCFLWVIVLLGAGVLGYFSIDAFDVQYVVSGIFGIYLLACAYAAVGLYMSGLTTYQLVAAIATLAFLALLNLMGSVGQSIDFVRDITYWLSMSDRVDNFRIGLISSKDVLYFLLIIFLFLSLSVLKLTSGRSAQSKMFKQVKYISLIVFVLFCGYISSLPQLNGYYDTTRYKTNTLTPHTQEVLSKLEAPLKMTVYSNVINYFAHIGAPKFRIYDLKKFEDYTRFLPNLSIEYQPYYNYTLDKRDKGIKDLEEKARKSATAYGYEFDKVLRPREIEEKIDLSSEKNGFVRVLSYKNKTAVLRMFFDQIGYPREAEITAAVKNLLQGPCRVGVLAAHQERSVMKEGDKDYSAVFSKLNYRGALINQGFEITEIDLATNKLTDNTVDVLLFSDPMEQYSKEELQSIRTYLSNGGNALLACEPGKTDLLNSLFKEIGVTISEGVALQKTKDFKLNLIQAKQAKASDTLGFQLSKDRVVSLSGTTALRVSDTLGFSAYPLLQSATKELWWHSNAKVSVENDSVALKGAKLVNEPLTFAWALQRNIKGKSQRIAVFGDADFMSNKEISRRNVKGHANSVFVNQLFRWFSEGAYPVNIAREKPIDNKILWTQTQIQNAKWVFVAGGSLCIALFGALVLWQRKRK